MKSRKRASALPNPPEFPALYIIEQRGDKMAPLIVDGARLAVSRDEWPRRGDFIVIWQMAKECDSANLTCVVRRMTLNLAHTVRGWPHREHPDSEAHAALMFETLNPPRHFALDCCNMVAVHKVLGDQAREAGRD